jgi:hypothetical protein
MCAFCIHPQNEVFFIVREPDSFMSQNECDTQTPVKIKGDKSWAFSELDPSDFLN